MDFSNIMGAISTVGFPIVCCGVLFYQNEKLRQSIDGLKETMIINSTLLKQLTNDVINARKENENE